MGLWYDNYEPKAALEVTEYGKLEGSIDTYSVDAMLKSMGI